MDYAFDLKNDKMVEKFTSKDPFNPQNTITGYINKRQGQLYGCLWITHVNGKEVPQLIYSAPKQHYPFDSKGKWEFPECDTVELYEKIDGTCIIGYHYKDHKGAIYSTFKTRLRPFLGSGKYGNFLELWKEMISKYDILDLCEDNPDINLVFELYGKRNKILIDYDVSLDTKCIFGINSITGEIYTPVYSVNSYLNLKAEGVIKSNEMNQDCYVRIQQQLENELSIDEKTKIIKGKEGYVMYFIKDGVCVQIKNKPPSILKYHWSGDAIHYESIYTTINNAYENWDSPTYDNVVELLKEEFDESKIEKSRARIDKAMTKVFFERKTTYEVIEFYKGLGINILEDKGTVMRILAKKFPKQVCCLAYNLLVSFEKGRV